MRTGPALAAMLAPIMPQMGTVESVIQGAAALAEEPLGTGLRQILSSGKRLRPALVILSGQLFVPSDERFLQLAAAIELLHTATLIHDDVIDQSPCRRGRATLHTQWPASAAVLAGDCLMAQAVSLVAELDRPILLRVFARALCAMSAGEVRALVRGIDGQNAREEYYRSAEAKTASLCAAATEMAGLLADAEESQVEALRLFGRELGLAFQVADDLLDYVGDDAQLGKPAGSDLRQGKLTLPLICYVERAPQAVSLEELVKRAADGHALQMLLEAVRASGAIEAALAEAHAHADLAQSALRALPDGAARRTLGSLAEYVVVRQR